MLTIGDACIREVDGLVTKAAFCPLSASPPTQCWQRQVKTKARAKSPQKPVFSQRGTLLPRFPPPPLQHDHIHAPTTRTAFLQLWLLFLSPVLAKHGKGCCSLMQVDHQGSFSKPTPETWLCCTDPIYLRCYSFFSSTGGARWIPESLLCPKSQNWSPPGFPRQCISQSYSQDTAQLSCDTGHPTR